MKKSDVSVAENYLSEKEVKELDRLVTMYLDYAELQASKKNLMRIKNWVLKLNVFLSFNESNILERAGQISFEMAKIFAEEEFQQYRSIQDRHHKSDFDQLLEVVNNECTVSSSDGISAPVMPPGGMGGMD